MLELPKTGWLRRYRVRANGETDQAQLDALGAGITIEGVEYAGIEAKLDRTQGANCWLTMGLREGKNREIKRVLEHLGLEVNRLIRLSFGPFQLLDLEEGKVEEVRTRVLRDQLGAALAAEAGVDFGEATAPVLEGAKLVREKSDDDRNPKEPKAARGEITRPDVRKAAPARAKGARAGDPRPQQSRANEQRSGERTLRRREAPSSEERARPRRHVSTLRTSEEEAARSGPRKRIERTDTRDRHDRSVSVERKVSVRLPGVSPSAEGKRARIARSGGPRRTFESGGERREHGERPMPGRSAPGGNNRSDARPSRFSAGGDRPQTVHPRPVHRALPPRAASPLWAGSILSRRTIVEALVSRVPAHPLVGPGAQDIRLLARGHAATPQDRHRFLRRFTHWQTRRRQDARRGRRAQFHHGSLEPGGRVEVEQARRLAVDPEAVDGPARDRDEVARPGMQGLTAGPKGDFALQQVKRLVLRVGVRWRAAVARAEFLQERIMAAGLRTAGQQQPEDVHLPVGGGVFAVGRVSPGQYWCNAHLPVAALSCLRTASWLLDNIE